MMGRRITNMGKSDAAIAENWFQVSRLVIRPVSGHRGEGSSPGSILANMRSRPTPLVSRSIPERFAALTSGRALSKTAR
jgi:hypothetical protein